MCLLQRGNRMYLTERLNAAGWKIGWTEKFPLWGWQHLKWPTCVARWPLRQQVYDRSQAKPPSEKNQPVAATKMCRCFSALFHKAWISWSAFNTISWTRPPRSHYSTSVIITCSLNSAWQRCVYALLKRNGPQHKKKKEKKREGTDKSIYVGRFTRRRAFIRKKRERLSTHSITTEAENKLPE